MTSRPARLVRAALAAGLTTFVAALSHSLAGAPAPGSLSIVLSLAFSLLVCIALTGKTLSVWRLSAAVGTSQFAYHGLFTLFGGTSAWTSSAVTYSAHAHLAAGSNVLPAQLSAQLSGVTNMAGVTNMGSMNGHDGLWMPVAHVVAALTTIAALHYGEHTFWKLVHGVQICVRGLFAPMPALPIFERALVRVPNGRDAAFPPELHILISAMRHRGPPVATPIW